jgi:hypothetical protein
MSAVIATGAFPLGLLPVLIPFACDHCICCWWHCNITVERNCFSLLLEGEKFFAKRLKGGFSVWEKWLVSFNKYYATGHVVEAGYKLDS